MGFLFTGHVYVSENTHPSSNYFSFFPQWDMGSESTARAMGPATHRLAENTGITRNAILPSVHQTSLGTLYEEPCVLYLRVSKCPDLLL